MSSGVLVKHLFGVWALTLSDFHFFLGTAIASPFFKLVHVAYPPLILLVALRFPMMISSKDRWLVYPGLLIWLLASVATTPFAANTMLARISMQYLLFYYVLAVATTVGIRHARHAVPILAMLVLQFAWWALWARQRGLVPWHPLMSNYDGFGALMVQGAGICFWFGMGAPSKKHKIVLFLLAGYCVMGVVTSFARGAFLSLVALAGWIWLRSPRKVVTAGWGIAGALVVFGAASVFHGGESFWAEITSSFEEGTTEGTGLQRWALWNAGWEVFKAHPILGVGGANFGAFAAGYFREGDLEQFPNPGMLYGFNLHNSYVQILCEFGVVGVGAFVWLLVDFARRNRALRDPEAGARWTARSGSSYSLYHIALAIEAANVANLLSGVFYASLFFPWFFTTWAINRMLWRVTRPDPDQDHALAVTRTSARHNRPG